VLECSNLLSWPELRQGESFAGVFEHDLDVHADLHVFDRAANDVAAESRPFVEIDPGGDGGVAKR
jgi:hypothetical protein